MRINTSDCIACGMCSDTCPNDAIKTEASSGYSRSYIDPDLCTDCGVCLDSVDCPGEAIVRDI